MEPHIFAVTEVNQLVKGLLDNTPVLQGILVRGELSNYKIYPSGHHYFTLKDPEGALRCVMFKGSALRLRFRPENGMKALALGRVPYDRWLKYVWTDAVCRRKRLKNAFRPMSPLSLHAGLRM